MGKYSEIVKRKSQNSEPENQKVTKPESNKTIKEQNSKTGNVESNKSGRRENIKTREPENQKVVSEDLVNLSIKVPRRLRQKWVAESRLRGTTLTAIISDYLKTELGS
ncbi:hypothetical protein [Myxosarcina sp. GI1(2024)]